MNIMHKNIKEYENFATFILSHNRSDRVITYRTLKRQNYSGKIYVIVDDEDSYINEYKNKYQDQVIVFNKQEAIDSTDSADVLNKRNSVVYARNYVYKIAKELGLKYFLVLDDDYTAFTNVFDNERNYITKGATIKNLDNYLCSMLRFLKHSNADCVAMSQGGDYIGGQTSRLSQLHANCKMSRKAMNAFFLRTDSPLKFSGRINEDVNMYISEGSVGKIIFTYPRMRLEQIQTQLNSGGLTDIYLDVGTYVKSFYSILHKPSCVRLMLMGNKNKRIHHKVLWKNTAPMIISEQYKK